MTGRSLHLLVLVSFCAAAAAGPATALPKKLGYSFYVQGEPAGRADLKISESSKALVIESKTRVLVGYSVLALTARTVADPKTFAVRDFSYQGSKGDHTVTCEAHMLPDSAYGFIEMDGTPQDKQQKLTSPRTLLFEDWLMEHEILMALTQAHSSQKTDTYGLLFTSSFTLANVTMGYSGDVIEEAGPKSLTARKLIIIMQGAEPFESHVDPVRGVPVYIRFANSRTEVFLDEIFGENPVTYYQPGEKLPSGK